MNICHLISGDLWAGAEVQAYTMMTALSEIGDFNLSAIVLNRGKLAEKLAESGIEVSVVDESTSGFIALKRQIREIASEGNIDVLHTHRYKENIVGAMIKRRAGVRGLVQTVHGMGEPFGGLKLLRSRINRRLNHFYTNRRFDRVLAVSDDIRRSLSEVIDPARIVTVHNSIDMSRIKPERSRREVLEELGIPPEAVVIGSAGRMVPVKGFEIFLEACGVIHENRPDIRFLLVGDGPRLEALKARARESGADKYVLFPGFRDDIHDLLNSLDIFVVSSYHEGIPMVVLEAMTLGRVVVSTAVGGILEIIEDGRSGVLVEDVDPKLIAESCLRLLENDALRREIELNAPTRIADKFGIDAQRRKIAEIYREVVN